MIADFVVYFIIMMILSFIFETRIIPQMGVVGLVLVLTISNPPNALQSSAYPIILYSINIIYAFVSILPNTTENKTED